MLIIRANTFIFPDLSSSVHTAALASSSTAYLLDIACYDYDLVPMNLITKSNETVRFYSVDRGGVEQGELVMVGATGGGVDDDGGAVVLSN